MANQVAYALEYVIFRPDLEETDLIWEKAHMTERCLHTLPFKNVGVSKVFFLKEINTSIQQGCIKLIKSDTKEFLMLQKMNFLFIK